MPTLPSITVTAPQLAKCVEAFTDADGYKAWLKNALIDEVERRSVVIIDNTSNAAKATAVENLKAQLPEKDPPWVQPA